MNYYDELGLSPKASAEEVKEAYRTLMRLLHPDLQQEPDLQRAAELQVKKLNRIYAILSDAELRRRYDQQLAGEYERSTPIIIHAPPPPARSPFLKRSSIAWTSAVTAFLILLVWMATRDVPLGPAYNSGASTVEPAPAAAPPAVRAASPRRNDAPSTAEADRLRVNLARAIDERDAALAEADHLRSKPAPVRFESPKHAAVEKTETRTSVPEPEVVAVHAPPQPAPVLLAKAEPPQPAPAPVAQRNPVAGTWIYRPPQTPPKNKELYPPEFIETSITEEHGELRGTYRARYHIPDRPIAPDVNFQFAGAFSGDSGSLPWSGAGGAKGEVTFKLMADHSLRVDWVASQLGALGFYKGTAVLVKRAD